MTEYFRFDPHFRVRCRPVAHQHIPLEEVEECLERSGYLLESDLVRALTDRGFFVEPNQVIRDPRSGKSREIDLVAEHYIWTPENRGVSAKTYFVVEVINNKFPFVLLTQRPRTPNVDFESYVKYICTPDETILSQEIYIPENREPDEDRLFSQYCVLTQKNRSDKELMASHPDDVYGSFQKLSEYIEEQLTTWNSYTGEEIGSHWRAFFWLPMLVVGGQLVSVTTGENGISELKEVSSGYLEFNWHAGDERRTTFIEVLTVSRFLERVTEVVAIDQQLEEKLHALRTKSGIASQGT